MIFSKDLEKSVLFICNPNKAVLNIQVKSKRLERIVLDWYLPLHIEYITTVL